MRNKKKMIVGFAVIFLSLILTSQSFAWGARPPRPPAPEKRLKEITARLELTDEQKARLKAGEERMRKEMEANRKELKKIADELKEELEKDAPDRNRVHNYISQMGKLHNEMQIKRMDSLLDLKQMLTPEQKEKFKQMLKKEKRLRGKGQRRMRRPEKGGDREGQ